MGRLFGTYLRSVRESRNKSQSEVAVLATAKGTKKITQPFLTQLEKGLSPDAKTVNQLAKALDVRPGEFLFKLALDLIDEYQQNDVEIDNQDRSILETWEAAAFKDWTPALASDRAGENVSVDEVAAGMRSMAEFVRENDVRDIDSLAQWQKEFPGLEVFWVIAPNFVDSSHPQLRETVLNNIRKGVHYYYFIKKGDAEKGEAFYQLLNRLALESRRDNDIALKQEDLEKYIHYVEFPKEIVGLIPSDVVIANPHSDAPVGFRSIRSAGKPKFGVAIDENDLSRIIDRYSSYFGIENVFPF
ncbi:MAG: helix-turn-helix transcriptional regulator [Acidobacteria bacterium]|nr:helix-turn-helix transcriptional regulator [Acidobacteriota bacterium]